MNRYLAVIDVPQDEEWSEIVVETLEVEADSAYVAQEKAEEEASKLYKDFYVWTITEADKL